MNFSEHTLKAHMVLQIFPIDWVSITNTDHEARLKYKSVKQDKLLGCSWLHLAGDFLIMVVAYIIFEIIFTIRVGCKGRYDVG